MQTGTPTEIIGQPVPRIDGPLKTTGTAKYASDYNLPGIVYAVPVSATIASGKIKSIDTGKAAAMPGVIKIYDYRNFPRQNHAQPGPNAGRIDEHRPPLQDATVSYAGEYVACVVAKTMSQAVAAANAVKVSYGEDKFNVSTDLSDGFTDQLKEKSKRGDVDAAFQAGPVTLDETYITPIEVHNPIELHATVVDYRDGRYTFYETSQGVLNSQSVFSQMLGVPKENIQVITKFLGSGFGGKLWPWPQALLAAGASKDLGMPVKAVVDRGMMFTCVGHRPRTQQRIRLAATHEGKITCIQHDYTNHTSLTDDVAENCGEATPFLYSTANLRVRSSLVKRNVGTPTPMRGPGAVPGLYALESAMDELAIKLKMDPVELRLKNDTLTDESSGKPFSSRHLAECIRMGAERFGWSKYTPAVGSMRKGDLILGWGMACASWSSGRRPSQASMALMDDGSAVIRCATQDIGTGTYTVFAQAVSAKTGLPLEKITVTLGDSVLPPGPLSGGSMVTGVVLPAIDDACDAVMKAAVEFAANNASAFKGADPGTLAYGNGYIYRKGALPSSGTLLTNILREGGQKSVTAEVTSQMGPELRTHSVHSFGAHFVEVTWDPGIARLRVSRIVSAMDVGKIINRMTAANQIEGAAVMGVGMALLEEGIYDHRTGRPVNNNLADYMVSTNADHPEMEVLFTDIPDKVMGSWGARGCGEIGLAGVAPAITAAVYHATGVRVRELPIRIEDLLPSSRLHTA